MKKLTVLLAAANDADIRIISMYSRSPKSFCLFSADDAISSPEDLKGKTVAGEIKAARYAMVLELLRDPHQAIGPIANLCGWRSETHLMHDFKRRMGMTMRAWRRRHLHGD